MKYMVMECHPAYAVLMDEASRIVHAANLHYEVGQVVESPVLLEQTAARPVISRGVRRFIAAAACFALMAGAGALYYRSNYMAYSSIVVSAAADMRMEVSRSGRVLSVQPLNQDAVKLLADYDCKGKDQLTVTNELIERATQNGYVQKGDTVHVYYDKAKNKDSESYQNDVAQAIVSHDMTADVHGDYDSAVLTPPKTETASHTETAPQTTGMPEPMHPKGNTVLDPETHTDHHPDPVERPAQDAPAAPGNPKPVPGAEPTAPRIADPAKEHKTPETPADNKPADNKPAEPAAPDAAPKPAEPAKEPAAPAEQKPAPAQKEEKPAKEPAPAEPHKPEPAAPGGNVNPPEKPDPGRNEERPHENAPEQHPHEEPAKPHDAEPALAPQAPAPAAGAPDEQKAPEPPAAPVAPEPPAVLE